MLKNRVIPCLLLKDGGLVKTREFADPQYVGDPVNAIRIFNEKQVDELMVLDIEASKEGRPPSFDLIRDLAEECFMPLTYGGGVRSADDARRLSNLGVEKVCVQTAALDDLSVVSRIAEQFGSQAVVVSVDVKRGWFGKPKLYSATRDETVGKPWLEHLRDAEAAGAGEVVVNAVHRDGTREGMDLELIREASEAVSVPLVAVGGVGSLEDIRDAVEAGASAVAAGAFFVFHGPHRAVLITYPSYEELEELLGPATQ